MGWEDLLEKGKVIHSVFWLGEFHGLYSPWGHKESDMTERLSLSFSPEKLPNPGIKPRSPASQAVSLPFGL